MRVDRRSPDDLLIQVDSESETESLGQALGAMLQPGDVVGLVGPLGTGKTRIVRAIAEFLGVDPTAIVSPTFLLILEYEGVFPIYHFDTYRLEESGAFEELGVHDYFDRSGICLIEWADRVVNSLPQDTIWLTIEYDGVEGRRLMIQADPERLDRLASTLQSEPTPN